MATTTEIEAAYTLVFEAEKAKAEQLIALLESVQTEINELSASIPATGSNSTVATYINQALGQISMLNGNMAVVKNTYGLNPPMSVDPMMMPPPPM